MECSIPSGFTKILFFEPVAQWQSTALIRQRSECSIPPGLTKYRVRMNLQDLLKIIREFHQKLGVEYTPQTSVVSPLFPGQFNYCLDEVNVYLKYGDLIHLGEEHFQKIQPAIRLSDYNFFIKDFKNDEHLGTFALTTVSGFNSFPKIESEKFYRKSVQDMLLLLHMMGFDKNKIKVSYFSGNDAKSVEESRKNDQPEMDRKIKVDYYIPEDSLKYIWLEEGLEGRQLEANNTRDNFLTSAWFVTRAPWGYRNEIFYQLPDGYFLDIGTIERMTLYPTVITEKDSLGQEAHFVTKIDTMDVGLVIDAVGIERLLQALEGKHNIWDIQLFQKLRSTNIRMPDIERLRILHRIFTDCPDKNFQSRNRKKKVNWLIRDLNHLDLETIEEILNINAEIYKSLFPDLSLGIEPAIKQIKKFREVSTTFPE